MKVKWEAVAPLPHPVRKLSWRPSGVPEISPPFSSDEAALRCVGTWTFIPSGSSEEVPPSMTWCQGGQIRDLDVT